MNSWPVIGAQDEASFFEDHIRYILTSENFLLPSPEQTLGEVITHWDDVGERQAYVQALGGTPDDRLVAMAMVVEQLKPHGYRQASWDLQGEGFRRIADWSDVMAKAKRLIQSGGVQILRNGVNNIVAQVQGDHGSYQTEINRQDPNSQAITGSNCECGWGEFQNQPRTRQWKKFQDRPCSHTLAAYWLAQSTPVDEEYDPASQQSPSLFNQQPEGFGAPQGAPGAPVAPQGGLPTPFNAPAPQGGAPGPSGSPADVLPQFPMANQPPPPNPASVPGLRGPTPTDPIQNLPGPGGTFSSWKFPWHLSADDATMEPMPSQVLNNSDLVQLRYPDTATMVGRPESGQAGLDTEIPQGSVGEVLGTHPSTGMVNVLWMGKKFDQNGKLAPFGAQGWHFNNYLIHRPDLKKPGPAVRRAR